MINNHPDTCPWCYKNLKKTHLVNSLGSRWIAARTAEGKPILVQRYPHPSSHLGYYDMKNLGFYLEYTFSFPNALTFSFHYDHLVIQELDHGT